MEKVTGANRARKAGEMQIVLLPVSKLLSFSGTYFQTHISDMLMRFTGSTGDSSFSEEHENQQQLELESIVMS